MNRLFLCALVVVSLGCMTTNAVVVPANTPTPTLTPTPTSVNTPIYVHTSTPKRVGFVTVQSLHVRACPNGNVIDVIYQDQEVVILGERTITIPNVCEVWYNIIYDVGAGWACAEYIDG